jgi:hypothetical protein
MARSPIIKSPDAQTVVQEYGPLDLADGTERPEAVQMICRLMLGLGRAAKLGDGEEGDEQRCTVTKVRKGVVFVKS